MSCSAWSSLIILITLIILMTLTIPITLIIIFIIFTILTILAVTVVRLCMLSFLYWMTRVSVILRHNNMKRELGRRSCGVGKPGIVFALRPQTKCLLPGFLWHAKGDGQVQP